MHIVTARSTTRPGTGPLRVLYSFPHPLGGPGIGWTAWNQVAELIAAGHEVDVFAASFARPVPGAARASATLTVAGRRVPHRLLGGDRAYALHDAIVARRLRRAARAYDVVHTWPLAGERTLRAAAQAGVAGVREAPNTHTAHAYEVVAAEIARLGIDPRAAVTHRPDPARLRTEEREWAAATAVLAPSDAVRESFLRRGFAPERLLRHRYGCLVPPAPPSERPAARAGALRAVFVGRGEPRKGLHHALEAWRDAGAPGTFDLYGTFAPGYEELLGSLLDQPGVVRHGFVADTAAAFAEADVLVLPSLEEGSALVTYEAQAAGCALLVSEASGAWMTEGVHGYTHRVGDTATLTAQLTLLASDPPRLRALQSAARARRDELSWRSAGDRLVEAYRDAIAISSPSVEGSPDHALVR